MELLPSSILQYGKDVWSSYLPLSTCMVRMYGSLIFLYPTVWLRFMELLSSSIHLYGKDVWSFMACMELFSSSIHLYGKNVIFLYRPVWLWSSYLPLST